MLSNKLRKQIQQLNRKKYRQQWGLFVAEGEKVVQDLLAAHYVPVHLLATKPYENLETILISNAQMRSISHFATPSPLLGVFELPQTAIKTPTSFHLVLDQIKDPGNLGTLIRLSDWYGLNDLVCSLDSVDCYNPKVVQASMGSIARVQIHYCSLENHLKSLAGPIYFADLNGASLYAQPLQTKGALVLGSESHGISPALYEVAHQALTISKQNKNKACVESLNVAVAGAIFLHEFFRP